MNKYLVIVGTAFLMACGNSESTTEVKEITEDIVVEITKHGDDISEDGAITPAEFLAQFNGVDSLETKLAANISEVCAKKGCWMTLDLGDEKTMRVTFKDYGFFVPKDAAGKLATIQGVARIDTTDVLTLKHYASDANATQEEIDAITEPEINYSFEATGVVIKQETLTTIEKYLINILIGCFLASFFIACDDKPDERQLEKSCAADEVEVSAINPNGDSELALLMRQLFYDADSLKQSIINDKGNVSDEFISELERIHSAIPTDPEVKTAEFIAFNDLMINEAKELQAATDNKAEAFNQFVNRCINCHQVVCPGPIKRINKLKIINPN